MAGEKVLPLVNAARRVHVFVRGHATHRRLVHPDLGGDLLQCQRLERDRPALEEVALLLDDAIDSGRSMARAVDAIRASNSEIEISRASLIVRNRSKGQVDLYHKVIAPPRAYEWNILHRKIASHFGHGQLAVDLDGVLCANCPVGTDEDELAYLEWLPSARPYLIPAFEIDDIVTCRLEKYRKETEEWLRKHDVRYKKLHMWAVQEKSDRRGRFARHKIDTLLVVKPDMFWESNWGQSQKIWDEIRVPTLCIDNMTLLS